MVAVAAVPSGATKAMKDTYVIAECDGTEVAPPERIWLTGKDGVHIRGISNLYTEYALSAGAWVETGTNQTYANGNFKFPDFEGPAFGLFSFRGTIGDFDGTWSWANTTYGRAAGKSTDGKLVKVKLGIDPAGYPALPGECLVTEFVVTDPHG